MKVGVADFDYRQIFFGHQYFCAQRRNDYNLPAKSFLAGKLQTFSLKGKYLAKLNVTNV